MPQSRIMEAIRDFFKQAGENIVEERVAEYIVKEIQSGRDFSDIIKDPYVRNRIGEGHMQHVLEKKEILEAVEDSIKQVMKKV